MSPPSPLGRPSLWRRLRTPGLVLTALLAATGLLSAWSWQTYVVDEPGPGFTRAEVLSIIAQESPVYYRDGTTPIGVFFDQEHRRYVPFAELPQDWINAIVASEDGNFFLHPGVDPKHVLRALVQNVRAGHVVAGGSTLTQQTAKNLYYRPDRSLRAKGVELVDALRLEAHFSKQDILEFYANQFHVSANGRGLGIAAKYFFDKEPSKLTTKECAYIAGMVKGPANYNPFIGATPERRAKAQAAAESRVAYVLGRMRDDGYLDERRYAQLSKEPLVFHRGTFQYDRSVVLDEVQRELEDPSFVELFDRLGIENPSTAGIQIITTLDPTVEREATYALSHHLTDLGGLLESTTIAELRRSDRTVVPMEPGVALSRHELLYGTAHWLGEALTLDVGGRPCEVDGTAINRIFAATRTPTAKGNKSGAPDSATQSTAAQLSAALPEGSFVLGSVREASPGKPPKCDLELRPTLQGGAVVLEEGQVRALVGGNDNRNFDRATQARRQFGSTWKPLVYESAIHLGWLPTDTLDNRRNVFPFRDVYYFPAPDHANVSWLPMTLVGARSENLASVWLLYHLTDQLNPEQLRRLADLVGLSRRADETPEAWMQRLRDTEGIRSSPDRYEEYAFTLARQDVLSGLAFGPHPEDALALRSLQHGRGFAQERARLQETVRTPERDARLASLATNLLSLEELMGQCTRGDLDVVSYDPATGDVACGPPPAGYQRLGAATESGSASAWDRLPVWPPELGGGLVAPEHDRAALAAAWLDRHPVGGALHQSTLRELRASTDRRAASLFGRAPWEPDVLALNPDFRVLVGIRYLQSLIHASGVAADIPTTLTLPLGAADLTLMDAAALYQSMLRGNRYQFEGTGYEPGGVVGMRSSFGLPAPDSSVAVIAEIRDAAGNTLYRATPRALHVSDPVAGEMVGDILRNVVRLGTGRRAANAVSIGGQPLPLAGKTGTTNDYRNAAFVGIAPRTTNGVATWGDGFTVAVYVGYDDNRPMRRGNTRVQGASGALPVWLGIVQGMADAGMLGTGGVAEYTPSEHLIRLEIPPLEPGQPSAGALVPVAPTRQFVPFTEPAVTAAGDGATPITAPPAPAEAAPSVESEEVAAPSELFAIPPPLPAIDPAAPPSSPGAGGEPVVPPPLPTPASPGPASGPLGSSERHGGQSAVGMRRSAPDRRTAG